MCKIIKGVLKRSGKRAMDAVNGMAGVISSKVRGLLGEKKKKSKSGKKHKSRKKK